jgi:hypothetical protein
VQSWLPAAKGRIDHSEICQNRTGERNVWTELARFGLVLIEGESGQK